MKEQGFGEPTITDNAGNWMEATNDGNKLVVSEINEWSKSNYYLKGNKVKITNSAEEWDAGKNYSVGDEVKVSTPGGGDKFYEATGASTGQDPSDGTIQKVPTYYRAKQNVLSATAPDESSAWEALDSDPNFQKQKMPQARLAQLLKEAMETD